MKLKSLAVAAATSVSLAAGGAHAATYLLTQDGCTGGCGASPTTPVGSITTAQVGTNEISVTVTLTSGGTFHDTNDPQHHALVFDLSGAPTITISGLGSPFVANGSQAAGSHSSSPFGDFDYVINFPHQTHPPVETTFSFDITAPGLNPMSFIPNANGIYFATDIWAGRQTGNTGNVGALGPSSAAPEPATWALMLVGFGGLGGAIRRRRAFAEA